MALRLRRNSDLILALFVVAIAAMLLIPLPTTLLDFLLAANISFALLMLLVGLYMPNALALLAFPSLLLLTTLFRLGLNVASSRLILSEGYAGRVIEAFGTFLIRGEIVVGVIIFTIITIVNFIVIARGSSRVSEVAARFALDSLPGKQMAIDSDLRSGLISAEQAQARRDELRKESQLYGSMDGAMKFVQGDAIAGLFIIVTNIVGGIYLGVSNGLSFSEAVETYTVLTVGDGLVSQIPALFISICAGIVVTRVSSGENTTLGADVGQQIFSRPSTLVFAGILAMLIACVPGLPMLPFLMSGMVLIGSAYFIRRSSQEMLIEGPLRRDLLLGNAPLLGVGAGFGKEESGDEAGLTIYLDAAVLYRLYGLNAARYRTWWKELQADFYSDTGVHLPELRVLPDEHSAPSHYSVMAGDSAVESGTVMLDGVLVEVNPSHAQVLGLEVVAEVAHPLSGDSIFWAVQSPALRKIVEAGSIRIFDFMEFICLKVAAFYLKHPEEALTLTDVHTMLKGLEKKYPGLMNDALNKNYLNVSRMTDTLQELVREGVNVRDFKQIVEAIAAYCSSFGSQLSEEDAFDLQELVGFVRLTRKRQLVTKLLSPRNTLRVLTMSPEIEEALEEAKLDSAHSAPGLAPEDFDRMRRSLQDIIEPVRSRGVSPVSLLCRSDLRPKLISFLRSFPAQLPVLTFDELDAMVRVEPVAVWTM
ncbi:MAG: FHIPEP family type III secretion protein [Deltaproteobacteria bacterium]|nr:FHIPEP family type III secretion protein [Deltaproteobacteria bacterium]